MKSWIRKKVWNFLNGDSPVQILTEPERMYSDGLNVTIYGAIGGTVVEFRKYDKQKDQRNNKLYIISSEQNFSEQFSKIVSMEMMR